MSKHKSRKSGLYRLAQRCLRWFCDPKVLPEIEGDLQELYQRWVQQYGKQQAQWIYFWNAVTFLRFAKWSTLKPKHPINATGMFRSYLMISLRSIARHKTVAAINILGLALGMSLCLMVLMILKDQYHYDTYHPHPQRTYRITTRVEKPTGMVHYARTPLPIAQALINYPSLIENAVCIYPASDLRYAQVDDGRKELPVKGAFAGAPFFDVVGFELAFGNPKQALEAPYSVVLTRATAEKFFRDINPLGEVLTIGALGDFTITGVIEALSSKTHLPYEMYVSFSTAPLLEQAEIRSSPLENWGSYDAGYTYVLARKGVDPPALENALVPMASRALQSFEFKQNERGYTFEAQPFKNIVPYRLAFEPVGNAMSKQGLMTTTGIALVILLIAGFNYINLSVARSLRRTQEVGIRKVSGALRHQIIEQFMVESVLLALLALGVAYGIVHLLPMNQLQRQISQIELDGVLLLWLLGFSVVVGLLAGSLPAWLFSRITALRSLQSHRNIRLLKGLAVRKVFLTAQFAVSLVFIIVLLVFYQQSEYNATADYGFDQENLVTLTLPADEYQPLADALSSHTQVIRVAATSGNFGLQFARRVDVKKEREVDAQKLFYYSVDPSFVPVMGLQLVAGINFPDNLSTQEESFLLLNEKALSSLNLGTPEEALGETLWLHDSIPTQIIGVLKDFNFLTRKHPIEPLVLRYQPNEFQYLNIKVRDPQSASLRDHLQASWKKRQPHQPLEYFVYQEKFYEYNAYHADVVTIGTVAMMAILISCLGLLGIVTYSVQTRVKEIGIRKVIGASIVHITLLLSRDFLKLLLLASVIAAPIGHVLGTLLLASFVYKITIGPGLLVSAIALLLFTGLATIASQTIRAALANPVDSLRNE